jgi:endonuclease YncB( thermonuclease family)
MVVYQFRAMCYHRNTGKKQFGPWTDETSARNAVSAWKANPDISANYFNVRLERDDQILPDPALEVPGNAADRSPIAVFPVKCIRFQFELKASNQAQKNCLDEFLGIYPPGLGVMEYLDTKTPADVDNWRAYWITQFTKNGLTDFLPLLDLIWKWYKSTGPMPTDAQIYAFASIVPPAVVTAPATPAAPTTPTLFDQFKSFLGSSWQTIADFAFIPVQAAFKAVWGRDITAADLNNFQKTVDWILPFNFIQKVMHGQSIYQGESGELTAKDGLDFILKAGAIGISALAIKNLASSYAAKVSGANAVSQAGSWSAAVLTTEQATTKTALISGVIAKLWASAKAQPLIAVFAATEIPNLVIMTGFLRQSLSEEAGTDTKSLQFKLNDYTAAASNLGYTIRDNIKAQNWEQASNNLETLNKSIIAYESCINENKAKLIEIKAYENEVLMLDAFKQGYNQYKGEVPAVPSSVPESFAATISGITDGDTVKAKILDGTVYNVRIVGIDAPENKTNEGKLSTQYMQALALNKTAVLYVDPAHKGDQYGRVLAKIVIGDKDIGLEMIKAGKAFYWTFEPNKYVDDVAYAAAAAGTTAPISTDGTVTPSTPTTPSVSNLKLNVTSNPTNAKLFIDGKYTSHLTPSNESELKNVIGQLTPGNHTFRAEKNGLIGLKIVNLSSGDNGEISLELESPGLPGGTTGTTTPTAEKFTIFVDTVPSLAKLYIDGKYTGHLTPSNEKELKDNMALLTPGVHKFRAERKGMTAETIVSLTAGANPDIILTLGSTQSLTAQPSPTSSPASSFKINITTTPTNAKLFIDGKYTSHLTPSNEKELKNVIALFTPGVHKISAYKSGLMKEQEITIIDGDNGTIEMLLGSTGLPPKTTAAETEAAITAMSTSVTQSTISQGNVLNLPLTSGSPVNGVDASGFDNKFASYNVGSETSPKGKAGVFNGTSSYIVVTDSLVLHTNEAMSAAFSFKLSALAKSSSVINKYRSSTGCRMYGIYINSNNRLNWYMRRIDDVALPNIQSVKVFEKDKWYNVVCSWDGQTRRIYINGVLDYEEATLGNLLNPSIATYIGRQDGASYFAGSLFNVQLWNRGLTADEARLIFKNSSVV